MPLPNAPSPMPPVGAGTAPGQPPMGPTGGATLPTPNRGLQAAALAQVHWAVKLLEKALPMLGIGDEVGKDVMKALNTLSKHVPAGATSPGVENSSLQQMAMQQKQAQPQQALLKALGQGGAGGPPGMPAAA